VNRSLPSAHKVSGWAVRKVLSRACKYVQKMFIQIPVPLWLLFFLNLEQRRVDLLNMHILKRACEGMVEAAVNSIYEK